MTLRELFLSVCLHTTLPCDEIEVRYAETPPESEAAALMYNSGRMEILFNPKIKKKTSRHKNTMVHEVAHLVVYQIKGRKPYIGHGYLFSNECIKLSMDYGIRVGHCRNAGD